MHFTAGIFLLGATDNGVPVGQFLEDSIMSTPDLLFAANPDYRCGSGG